MVPDVGRHDPRGNRLGHVETAAQSGGFGNVLGVRAEEQDEVLQRVVAWIHRPDDLVKRAGHPAGRFEHFLQVAGRALRLTCHVPLGQLALQRHLGEAGADVVVEVAGDARALGVHRLAASHDLDLAADSPEFEQAHGRRHHAEAGQGDGDLKPPCLPEMGRDDDVHHGGACAPQAVAGGCLHLELITSRRKVAVFGNAAVADLNPVVVDPDDAVAEFQPARVVEVQAGEREFQAGRSGRQ